MLAQRKSETWNILYRLSFQLDRMKQKLQVSTKTVACASIDTVRTDETSFNHYNHELWATIYLQLKNASNYQFVREKFEL